MELCLEQDLSTHQKFSKRWTKGWQKSSEFFKKLLDVIDANGGLRKRFWYENRKLPLFKIHWALSKFFQLFNSSYLHQKLYFFGLDGLQYQSRTVKMFGRNSS